MKRKFRAYEETLLEDLQDEELAQEYLKVALEDKDPRVGLLALQNVAKARKLKTNQKKNDK